VLESKERACNELSKKKKCWFVVTVINDENISMCYLWLGLLHAFVAVLVGTGVLAIS
jgi:hypothetical protein